MSRRHVVYLAGAFNGGGGYMVAPGPKSRTNALTWAAHPDHATVYGTGILADQAIARHWPRAEAYMRGRGLRAMLLSEARERVGCRP